VDGIGAGERESIESVLASSGGERPIFKFEGMGKTGPK